MDLNYHMRMINKMIEYNRDATIADYLNIVNPGRHKQVVAVAHKKYINGISQEPKKKRKPILSKPPIIERLVGVYSNRGHINITNELTQP
jgi:hypothetical protein